VRILLLNDIVDHDNWGGNACAWTLRRLIAEALPDAEIVSLDSSWTIRRFRRWRAALGGGFYVGSRGRFDRFSTPFKDVVPFVADQFEDVAREWREGRGGPTADDFLAAVSGVDAIVFNAEGSTYRNNLSAVRSLFGLWYARTQLGVPGFFFNGSVTLTPVDPLLPAIVGRAFSVIDGIAVREPFSARCVKEWVAGVEPEVVPDSVFSIAGLSRPAPGPAYVRLAAGLEPRHYFCASLSMLLSGGSEYLRWGVESSGLRLLLDELRHVVPQLVLLYKDRQDENIIRELAVATKAVVFGPEHPFFDLLPLLENAAFIVTGRYHHLMFGALAGCPGIPLRTTSHKVDGLCELLDGRIGEPVDATNLKPVLASVRERALNIVSAGDQARVELRQCAERLGGRTARYGEMLREKLLQ
jgi:hypothetical protein